MCLYPNVAAADCPLDARAPDAIGLAMAHGRDGVGEDFGRIEGWSGFFDPPSLSLGAVLHFRKLATLANENGDGRRERIRTSGPYVPNVVLYQAELLSDKSNGL